MSSSNRGYMDLLGQQRGRESRSFYNNTNKASACTDELVPPSSEYQYKWYSFSIKHSYMWTTQVSQERESKKEKATECKL